MFPSQVLKEITIPEEAWIWNHNYIMETMKRSVTPNNLVIQIFHADFQRQALKVRHQ